MTRALRTCVSHLAHGDALPPGHVTQNGEDGEAGKETGATVPDNYYQRVPVKKEEVATIRSPMASITTATESKVQEKHKQT